MMEKDLFLDYQNKNSLEYSLEPRIKKNFI